MIELCGTALRPRFLGLPFLVLSLMGAGCTPSLLPLGGPVGEVSPGSALIGCERSGELVAIGADSHLDPACTYTGGFEIVASGSVLDCRGARISDTAGNKSRGIHIHAPTSTTLSNVVVRNCIVSGFLNNLRVSRDGFQELPAGGEYEQPFSGIVVENSRFLDSRGSGVFVNAYVTGVTLQDNEIARSGSVGVYLEAGSKDSVVQRSWIHDNGYGDVDPIDGVPFYLGTTELRVLMTGREGIAIDGSRNNRILGNRIHGNAAGGIFLYKNCGEFVNQKPASWWERRYGADGNRIEGNIIADEADGIWVGSRMGENQYFMDCSDPVYGSGTFRRIHLDYAQQNTIRENILVGVSRGVRVEDDGTTVESNQFFHEDAAALAILIGTRERTAALARPVHATIVRGNEAEIAGNDHPYAWIHGHADTVFEDNLTGGEVASLPEGTPPATNPWLFVISVWLP